MPQPIRIMPGRKLMLTVGPGHGSALAGDPD